MSRSHDPDVLFTGHQGLLPGCETRTRTLLPAQCWTYDAEEWTGCVVVVLSGELRLECRGGSGATYASGAVLSLGGLQLERLTNPGLEPAVLRTIRRPPPDPTGRTRHVR